jgi:hypothetical protein
VIDKRVLGRLAMGAVLLVASCSVSGRVIQIDETDGASGAGGSSGGAGGAAGTSNAGAAGTLPDASAGAAGAAGSGAAGASVSDGSGGRAGSSGGTAGSAGRGGGGGADDGGDSDISVIADSGDAEACTPIRCTTPNGNYCGRIGDGCGRAIDCGLCTDGLTCGGGGTFGVCGALPDSGACKPTTCQPVGGTYCGTIGNGCGGTLECGPCPTGQTCGLNTANVCGKPCPLCPLIPTCTDAGATTVSGRVTTGAAANPDPVYKASVYIPNVAIGEKLGPIPSGASCDRCSPLTQNVALASAVTGPDGTFVLQGKVPAGQGIPLVVQLGKWRYETTIDIHPCAANMLATGTARLPRTQAEGNIPLTALSTGNVDALECILRKIGVADTEFGNPGGTGRIHFYRNNGANYDAATPNQLALVGNAAVMDSYDQILFPCEGSQTNESAQALTNFVDYTSKGGRVFTTHFSYTWLYTNGGFATAGQWQVAQANPPNPLIANIDVTHPRGQDFANWLGHVGALSNPSPPQVSINDPRRNLNAVPQGQGGVRWIYTDDPIIVQHMTIDTPVIVPQDPDKVCGRVVYSDFHVANAQNGALTFPAECPTNDLVPQEKILEFMLFDLASCIGIDKPPAPPPLPPPPPPPLPPGD